MKGSETRRKLFLAILVGIPAIALAWCLMCWYLTGCSSVKELIYADKREAIVRVLDWHPSFLNRRVEERFEHSIMTGQPVVANVPPIIVCAHQGRTEILEELIARGVDPNTQTDTGASALHIAASFGHAETVKSLLARGASPNISLPFGGWTPLHAAACRGHIDVVRILAADEATNIDAMSNEGLTPFMVATTKGQKNVAQLLLKLGAVRPKEPSAAWGSEFEPKEQQESSD